MSTIIVTHTSPDWDAIGAVWMLKLHPHFEDADVVFVGANTPADDPIWQSATAVVDCGRLWEPTSWRFDHHHLSTNEALATCATHQVYNWYLPKRAPVIERIVALILAGDSGGRYGDRDAWMRSRDHGMHAVLSALKARQCPDDELLRAGMFMLDHMVQHDTLALPEAVPTFQFDDGDYAWLPGDVLLAEQRRALENARTALSSAVVYRSDDGAVVALSNASATASRLAGEDGARLVVFCTQYPNTLAVGCQRQGEGDDPHVGTLVQAILEVCRDTGEANPLTQAVEREFASWFRHPAGFYAGRGTAKAPDPRPLEDGVTIALLARWIDTIWYRPAWRGKEEA